jgi:hypothetical protein
MKKKKNEGNEATTGGDETVSKFGTIDENTPIDRKFNMKDRPEASWTFMGIDDDGLILSQKDDSFAACTPVEWNENRAEQVESFTDLPSAAGLGGTQYRFAVYLGTIDENTPPGREFVMDGGEVLVFIGIAEGLVMIDDMEGNDYLSTDHSPEDWNDNFAPNVRGITDPEAEAGSTGGDNEDAATEETPGDAAAGEPSDSQKLQRILSAQRHLEAAVAAHKEVKDAAKECKAEVDAAAKALRELCHEAGRGLPLLPAASNSGNKLIGDDEAEEETPDDAGGETVSADAVNKAQADLLLGNDKSTRVQPGEPIASTAGGESWRPTPLADLKNPAIKPNTLKKLAENEPRIITLGDWTDWQKQHGDWAFKNIKGLGKAAADNLADACYTFWAEQAKAKKKAATEAESPGGDNEYNKDSESLNKIIGGTKAEALQAIATCQGLEVLEQILANVDAGTLKPPKYKIEAIRERAAFLRTHPSDSHPGQRDEE